MRKILFTVLLLALLPAIGMTANISINTALSENNGRYYLSIENKNGTVFTVTALSLYFNGFETNIPFGQAMQGFEKKNLELPFVRPTQNGSYTLVAGVHYLNDTAECSAFTSKIITVGSAAGGNFPVSIKAPPVATTGEYRFRLPENTDFNGLRIFLPNQMERKFTERLGNDIVIKVNNRFPTYNNRSSLIVLEEKVVSTGSGLVHSSRVKTVSLNMGPWYAVFDRSLRFWAVTIPVLLVIVGLIIAAGIFLGRRSKEAGSLWIASGIVLAIALAVRFSAYTYPFSPFWDENYHVASAEKYIQNVFYMEPHPPLGKLIIAAGEVLLQPNKGVDKSIFVKTDYVKEFPQGFSFAGYRLFPTILAVLSCLVFFLLLYTLGGNLKYALMFSALYIMDNAMIVHNRSAMLEGSQLFFVLAALLHFAVVFKKESPALKRDYAALAALVGLAVAVKLNSMVLFLLFPVLAWKDYGQNALEQVKIILARKGQDIQTAWMGGLAQKTLVTIVSAAFVFCAVFYIHIALGQQFSNGYYRASADTVSIIRNGENGNLLYFPRQLRDHLAFIPHYQRGVPKWDPTKADENGSPAFTWPFGYKSINYRWDKFNGQVAYMSLQGNPLVWTLSLWGVILGIALIFHMMMGSHKEEGRGALYTRSIVSLLLLYAGYMAAVINIDRVMYLYHYLIPLTFGMVLFYLVFVKVFDREIQDKNRVLFWATVVMTLNVVAVYAFYSPLSYGWPLSGYDFMKRVWTTIWDLRMVNF